MQAGGVVSEKNGNRNPPGRAENGEEPEFKSAKTEDQDFREPLVDVFEEGDHLLVEAELPGISKDDVKVTFQDDVLTITAERGERKFHKRVLLPRDLTVKQMKISCRDGLLRIKCPK